MRNRNPDPRLDNLLRWVNRELDRARLWALLLVAAGLVLALNAGPHGDPLLRGIALFNVVTHGGLLLQAIVRRKGW